MRKLILMDKQIKEMPGRKSFCVEPFIKPCVASQIGTTAKLCDFSRRLAKPTSCSDMFATISRVWLPSSLVFLVNILGGESIEKDTRWDASWHRLK